MLALRSARGAALIMANTYSSGKTFRSFLATSHVSRTRPEFVLRRRRREFICTFAAASVDSIRPLRFVVSADVARTVP